MIVFVLFHESWSKFNSPETHKQHRYFCFFNLEYFFLKLLILAGDLFLGYIHSHFSTQGVQFFLRHLENPRSPWVLVLTWPHTSFLLFRELSESAPFWGCRVSVPITRKHWLSLVPDQTCPFAFLSGSKWKTSVQFSEQAVLTYCANTPLWLRTVLCILAEAPNVALLNCGEEMMSEDWH